MAAVQDRSINQSAYRELKETIKQDYPRGRFVAIDKGKIIADAASFAELHDLLNRMGKTSPNVLVVEAGVDYQENPDILPLGYPI